MKRLLLVVCLICSNYITAQNKKVVVMGSSSAYGYFPGTSIPRDSSWAFKVSAHYKTAGMLDTLYNIGTPGIDCYVGMPTGYTPPAGRNAPNPQFNITRAVSFNPDVIIINFPSNNYTFLSEAEIIACLQTMKSYAESFDITVFITTTQPRDDFTQLAERQKLRSLRDQIMNTFGVYALDFWTPIVQDPPIIIRPVYALGDMVHLNPLGHTVLKDVVVSKNIFFITVATAINGFQAVQINNEIKLSWFLENVMGDEIVMVQKQNATGEFETIGYAQTQLNGGGSYIDIAPNPGSNFYRLKVVRNYNVMHSIIAQIDFTGIASDVFKIYPNPTRERGWLIVPYSDLPATVQVLNVKGEIIQSIRIPAFQTRIELNVANFVAGNYLLHYNNGRTKKTIQFIK